MDSPERGSISPSERVTIAWRKMCRTGQIRSYVRSSLQEIENLRAGKEKINDHNRDIMEYLKAVEDWLRGDR